MNEGITRTVYSPIFGWKTLNKKFSWHFDENRPWTDAFKDNNRPGQMKKPVPVQQIKEWNVFKGDRVRTALTLKVAPYEVKVTSPICVTP